MNDLFLFKFTVLIFLKINYVSNIRYQAANYLSLCMQLEQRRLCEEVGLMLMKGAVNCDKSIQ